MCAQWAGATGLLRRAGSGRHGRVLMKIDRPGEPLAGYVSGPAAATQATGLALARAVGARAVVLVEGVSDQIAVETLAAGAGATAALPGRGLTAQAPLRAPARRRDRPQPHAEATRRRTRRRSTHGPGFLTTSTRARLQVMTAQVSHAPTSSHVGPPDRGALLRSVLLDGSPRGRLLARGPHV